MPPSPSDDHRPARRRRYAGKNPRRFADKYKEHRGDADTLAKVTASGKTPAGTHRPVMLAEVLDVLRLQPGEVVVDGTLGYGGHTRAFLGAGAQVVALDVDPLQLPRTVERLRAEGFGEASLTARQSNFAGLPRVLAELGLTSGADAVFADLGVSSMQIDDPVRGFSFKHDGPLDMRFNPQRGQSAADFLTKVSAEKLTALLEENADEPNAVEIARVMAGQRFTGTLALAAAIRRAAQPRLRLRADAAEKAEQTVRRVFQALRIALNDEFSALDSLLRQLPSCLKPGGRAAILTFHSGEDRRVKWACEALANRGGFSVPDDQPRTAGAEERRANPRSVSAKLRWLVKTC